MIHAGLRFGRLVAVRYVHNERAGALWQCRCDCGQMTIALVSNLRHGRTKSCGCRQGIRHGGWGSPEYWCWHAMLQRCNNPRNPGYKNYGDRGIKVCKRWHRFEHFYSDMGDRPAGLSIDRIDNDGDYKPSNCRWATQAQQHSNKRRPQLRYST
jgi:hypothetical protein